MSPMPADRARRAPVAALSLRRLAWRTALWLLLGGQIGAWLLFGAVVAPVAFRELPSSQIAGALVGPILTVLHLYGAAAGLGLGLAAHALGRGRLRLVLPLAMGAVCLYSHFGVSAEISEIRDLAFGPGGTVEAAGRFHQLHQLSMGLFIGVGIAALVLAALHGWSDERERAGAAVGAGNPRKATNFS